MKKNLPLIIITLLLAIAAVVIYKMNSKKSTLKIGSKAFAVEDTAKVNKIFLADKTGRTILLERKDNGRWKLNDKYEARQDAVNTLLETIKKLQVQSPVGKNARKTVIKDMASRSTKIEIYQGGNKPAMVYYVGDATQNSLGTYMLMEGAQDPYIMEIMGFSGYLSTRYFVEEYKWRSTQLFNIKIGDIAKVSVEFATKPKESFEMLVNDGKITLKSLEFNTPVESFDTTAAMKFLHAFHNIHFEAIEPFDQSKIDSILHTPVIFKISMTDKNGKETYIKSYRKKSPYGKDDKDPDAKLEYDVDRMFANINDQNEIVLIQFFAFDPILKELSYFETDPSEKPAGGEKGN